MELGGEWEAPRELEQESVAQPDVENVAIAIVDSDTESRSGVLDV